MAGAVDHVLEQKSLALGLRNAAAELPTYKRVHLGIFVDWTLDAEKAVLLHAAIMRLQVSIRTMFHVPPGAFAKRL